MSSPQKLRFRILIGIKDADRNIKLGYGERKTVHIQKPITVIGELEEIIPNGDYKIKHIRNENGIPIPYVEVYSAAYMSRYAKPLK